MDIFNVLTLLGGLSLFLFGMNIMGTALEKRAGSGLKSLLGRLTTNRLAGFLTGLGVTAVIQSSSATTVMVVGFVNSGLMTLRQSINVIMGANVGTTVTAWVLSLSGIDGDSVFIRLLKPSSFTPVLAVIGIALYMMSKNGKKRDTGMIFLGFATLMFGMETMSGAVSGLRDVPEFGEALLLFENPLFGVAAGMILTAIIQSSSASVGILQALSSTGQVTCGAAIPILMGMDIGTCITALLASIGTNRNARRAAAVHLLFNVLGTVFWLVAFYAADAVINFTFVDSIVSGFDIAVINSAFKLLCVLLMFPFAGLLERIACRLVPDTKEPSVTNMLDERLFITPPIAISRCRDVTETMASVSSSAIKNALLLLRGEIPADKVKAVSESIRADEETADKYEDALGTYLVRLCSYEMNEEDSRECAKLLHIIGDLERISDHAVNLLIAAEELQEKGIFFSEGARRELSTLTLAVSEITELTVAAFLSEDTQAAARVEPLEEVVDTLKEQLRARHILRLQRCECSIEAGFVWSDLLTDLERIADHCSNIAGCVIEMAHASYDLHEYLRDVKRGSLRFAEMYDEYSAKYALISAETAEASPIKQLPMADDPPISEKAIK